MNSNRKLQFLFLFSFLCSSCAQKEKSNHLSEKFNESDYLLVSTRKDSNNVKYFELYRNKYDSNKSMGKSYWDNGNLQSLIFFNGKNKEGPTKLFDSTGDISFQAFMFQNKKTGLTLYYTNGKITDMEVDYNDNELPLDTTVKHDIIKELSK